MRVPLLAIHGSADGIVAPRNAIALVRQYLALNGREADAAHAASVSFGESGSGSPHLRDGRDAALLAPAERSGAALPPPDTERRIEVAPDRTMTIREWRRDGHLVARLVEVDGLGHAWSGGDPSLPFTDAAPPAASDLVAGIFPDGLSSR